MRLCKIPDTLVAAGSGAAVSLVLFGIALMIAVPAGRLASSYALRGRLPASPLATPDATEGEVTVKGAQPAEERRILASLDGLSLGFDPDSVTVRVIPDLGACAGCEAAYLPETREVLLPRAVVMGDEATLDWALAHEMGHHIDAHYLDARQRTRFGELRGHPDGASWLSPERPWNQRPVEDFAEVVAVLVQPTVERPVGTVYGGVRHRAAMDRLLGQAGLHGEGPVRSPWAEAVSGQGPYLEATMRDAERLWWLRMIALVTAVAGGLQSMLQRLRSPTCAGVPRLWP